MGWVLGKDCLWSAIAVLVDALHNVLGSYRWFTGLDNVRITVWTAAAIYWAVVFWKPERNRTRSPEMEQYLLGLHRRVKFDLSRSEESLSRSCRRRWLVTLIFWSVIGVLVSRYFYRHLAAWQLYRRDWNDLIGKLQRVSVVAVTAIGDEYLNPKPHQLGPEPVDIWRSLGGLDVIRRMRRNARPS